MSCDVSVRIDCPACGARWSDSVDAHDAGLYAVCLRCRDLVLGRKARCPRCEGRLARWDERSCPRCGSTEVEIEERLLPPY